MVQVEFCVSTVFLVKQAPLESNLLVLLDICLLKVTGAASAHTDRQKDPSSSCGHEGLPQAFSFIHAISIWIFEPAMSKAVQRAEGQDWTLFA